MKSLWSGSISFGLVNIPIKLVSAVREQELDFDLLSKKDLAPIRYARISTSTGREIPYKDIVKGFEIAKGRYVVVTPEDFQKASPEKSKTINIVQFVKSEEIDPIFYDRSYFIEPNKGAAKAYSLLLKALEKTQTVGVAEFMLRTREHIAVIQPYQGVLMITQLLYKSEVLAPPAINIRKERITPKELDLAVKLIAQLTDEFDPAAFKDTYIAKLKKTIKAKSAGKKLPSVSSKIISMPVKDLMAELKESLSGTRRKAA